jgi:hypothetical protein
MSIQDLQSDVMQLVETLLPNPRIEMLTEAGIQTPSAGKIQAMANIRKALLDEQISNCKAKIIAKNSEIKRMEKVTNDLSKNMEPIAEDPREPIHYIMHPQITCIFDANISNLRSPGFMYQLAGVGMFNTRKAIEAAKEELTHMIREYQNLLSFQAAITVADKMDELMSDLSE